MEKYKIPTAEVFLDIYYAKLKLKKDERKIKT